MSGERFDFGLRDEDLGVTWPFKGTSQTLSAWK